MADKKKSSETGDEMNAPRVETPRVETPKVETPKMEERTLTSTTPEETEETGTVLEGAADKWVCIAKAYNKKEGWMKTTKAMQAGAAGCLIQVTTQQMNKDGTWTLAEAVCFAVRVNLAVEGDKARLE